MNLTDIKVLAVDYVDTLIQWDKIRFSTKASQLLATSGLDVSPSEILRYYQLRYIEYSLGNYRDDHEFFATVLADIGYFPTNSRRSLTEKLSVLRRQCSYPFRETEVFLQKASAHYRLILSSNHVRSWAERTLRHHNWETRFDNLLISSDIGFRKPSARFFSRLLEISSVSKSEIIVIGDSPVNDVFGATRANLRAVLIERNRQQPRVVPRIPTYKSLLKFLGDLRPEW